MNNDLIQPAERIRLVQEYYFSRKPEEEGVEKVKIMLVNYPNMSSLLRDTFSEPTETASSGYPSVLRKKLCQ